MSEKILCVAKSLMLDYKTPRIFVTRISQSSELIGVLFGCLRLCFCPIKKWFSSLDWKDPHSVSKTDFDKEGHIYI